VGHERVLVKAVGNADPSILIASAMRILANGVVPVASQMDCATSSTAFSPRFTSGLNLSSMLLPSSAKRTLHLRIYDKLGLLHIPVQLRFVGEISRLDTKCPEQGF